MGTAQAVPTIVNGSFEDGVPIPGEFVNVNQGDSTSITGWTVGLPNSDQGSVDYISTHWLASDGLRSIDLAGGSPGAIRQTINGLAVGQTYTILFDLAGNSDGNGLNGISPNKIAGVSLGLDSATYSFDTTGHSSSAPGWVGKVFIFTATSTAQELTFRSLDVGSAYGAALDNVRIVQGAVPEASSWALMILGLGAVGGTLRQRRRNEAKLQTA